MRGDRGGELLARATPCAPSDRRARSTLRRCRRRLVVVVGRVARRRSPDAPASQRVARARATSILASASTRQRSRNRDVTTHQRYHGRRYCSAVRCDAHRRRTPDDTLVRRDRDADDDGRSAATRSRTTTRKLVAAGRAGPDDGRHADGRAARSTLARAIDRVDDLDLRHHARDDAQVLRRQRRSPPTTSRARTRPCADPRATSRTTQSFASAGRGRGARSDARPLPPRAAARRRFAAISSSASCRFTACRRSVPTGRVVGAGPYVLRELTPYAAQLDANPYYFGDAAAVAAPRDPLRPRCRGADPDARRRLARICSQNAVRLDLVDEVARARRACTSQSAPSLILTYMMLNNDDPVLRDLRVREAIALALDRPAIIDAQFEGRAVLATGLLPPTHWAYERRCPALDPRSAARARAARRGRLSPGPDGVRLHLIYKTSADAFRVAIAHVLASQLAEVGIDGRGPPVRVRDVLRRHQARQLPDRDDADHADHRARLLLRVLPLRRGSRRDARPRRAEPLALPQRRRRPGDRRRPPRARPRPAQGALRARSSAWSPATCR